MYIVSGTMGAVRGGGNGYNVNGEKGAGVMMGRRFSRGNGAVRRLLASIVLRGTGRAVTWGQYDYGG